MRGNPSGERCAAQPSGRPHEPSGNRRPQMDGHPWRFRHDRTRLTDRLADIAAGSGVSVRRSVLVRAERVRRRAGVADRRGRFEVAEGDRNTAVGQEALDVVYAVRSGIDLDETPERAPLDPLGGEPIGLRIRGHDRER